MNLIKYVFNFPFLRERRKILGICDFRVTSFSIGRALEFNLKLLCESYENKVDAIDIALVYNPNEPVDIPRFASYITKDNLQYHLLEQFPLLTLNPKLNSVFIFNSKKACDEFLKKNIDNYYLSPSLYSYVNETKDWRDIYLIFKNFYLKNSFLPQLKIPESANLWAKAFINKHSGGRPVIATHLRLNPYHSSKRNADADVWKNLFAHCLRKHPDIVFLVLGRNNEIKNIPTEIKLKNVVAAGSFGDLNIQQNLAIIKNALFYMAPASGPAMLAFLSNDIPYIITNFIRDKHGTFTDYKWPRPHDDIPWQNKKLQKLSFDKETSEFLISQFDDLFNQVDKKIWKESLDSISKLDQEQLLNWPHLVTPPPQS